MYHTTKIAGKYQHRRRFSWTKCKTNICPERFMTSVSFGDQPVRNIATIALRKTAEMSENMKTNIEKIIQPGGLRQRNGRHHGMIHQRVINPCSIMLIIITMKSYLECNGMQKRMSSNLQFILTFERKGGEFTFLQNYFLNN